MIQIKQEIWRIRTFRKSKKKKKEKKTRDLVGTQCIKSHDNGYKLVIRVAYHYWLVSRPKAGFGFGWWNH